MGLEAQSITSCTLTLTPPLLKECITRHYIYSCGRMAAIQKDKVAAQACKKILKQNNHHYEAIVIGLLSTSLGKSIYKLIKSIVHAQL